MRDTEYDGVFVFRINEDKIPQKGFEYKKLKGRHATRRFRSR